MLEITKSKTSYGKTLYADSQSEQKIVIDNIPQFIINESQDFCKDWGSNLHF